MTPYTHGGDIRSAQALRGGEVLDFSANLNPLGVPPQAAQAARAAAGEARYPDPLCRDLRAAIARADGVDGDWVVCGSGAADLIFRLVFALRPRRAVVTAPAFSEYEQALSCVNCAVDRCVLEPVRNFDLDEGVLDAIVPGVELVFLCSPNNPTGRLADERLLLRAAARCRDVGAVLAVDECFLPLAAEGPGLAPHLAQYPNLLLLRALTKSYALAGLRVGYALTANEGLRDRLARSGPPWPVSVPAQAAGTAALTLCPDWPARARALVEMERPGLIRGLEKLGCAVVPGQANYLLFRLPGVADLKERLLQAGILIRSCANYHGLGTDWYRVCVRTGEENRRLLAAMEEVV